MIRIAHLADSHFDEKNRLEDNIEVHRAFVAQAAAAEVDLIVHAGDFFERLSTRAERNALKNFLQAAAEVAPVFGVRGNHDAPGDLEIFSQLRGRRRICIQERPEMDRDGRWCAGLIVPADGPHIACYGLPWFDRANIAAALPAETPTDQTTEATILAAKEMLLGLRASIAAAAHAGTVPILVAHVLAAGSETSTGQTLTGSTVELAPSDLLEVGGAYAALGHIHKPQFWHEGRVAYSGSPQRLSFGEPEPKGWNLVQIDHRDWRRPGGTFIEFQELPARRITLIECDWSEWVPAGRTGIPLDRVGRGDLVRLRYRIKPEGLHLVFDEMIEEALLEAGAAEVKIEAVLVHQDRTRSAEIVTAASTWEKLLAYWHAKGIEVDDGRRGRLHAKLLEIEAAGGIA